MVQDNNIRSFAKSPGKRYLLLFYFSWFVLALEISMGDSKFRVCVVLNQCVL